MNTDLQDIKYKELKETSGNSDLCASVKIRVQFLTLISRQEMENEK